MSDRKNLVSGEKSNKILPFGANFDSRYAYRKAERMVTAIYLVTNFVPETEPLRMRLRDRSLSLLSDILRLRYGFRSVKPEYVNDIIAHMLEVVSLLEIANAAGYLSRMNLLILQQESFRLCDFLRSREDATSAEGVALSDTYFGVPVPEEAAPRRLHMAKVSAGAAPAAHKGQSMVKDTSKVPPSKIKRPKGLSASAAKREKRRSEILNLFRRKQRVTVRDVTTAVQGYSGKTLQRELVTLVREGVLRREGERRWSIYTRAEPAVPLPPPPDAKN